jgi:hypothetical protein
LRPPSRAEIARCPRKRGPAKIGALVGNTIGQFASSKQRRSNFHLGAPSVSEPKKFFAQETQKAGFGPAPPR